MSRLPPEAERILLARACDGEHGVGCEMLAALLAADPPEKRDEELARATYQLACSQSGLDACRWVHDQAIDGDYGAFARSAYEPLCRRGAVWACSGLAEQDFLDARLDPSAHGHARLVQSRQQFTNACSSGHRWSCVLQAAMLVTGSGGPKDVTEGLSLLRRLCLEGYQPACNWLEEHGQALPSACAATP